MPKRTKAVEKKIETNKELLIDRFRKTPIIQVACEKVGVGRATYYRWKKEDPLFAEEAENAIAEGVGLINDMAESQLISAIRDKHMTAIIFWLKNRHEAYKTRVELSAIKPNCEELTPEQQETVSKALVLAGLLPEQNEPHE
ncbi:hypothetical protein COX05_03535 [candidate division WWE3 bacterium CG22_combo_CG10-13_8_21_14_all_39_12]|uniref:Uncharacterized protein n=1 Tax=candidate division WWE3 bacterium CG22_combo_CG10-13_8_21_14_all_39_12 TaxID=1975094 RepID=A0A2H0BH55_UNCKA|nr:MAG: hypothetical protein COX05_03535 [candidate division WWE3 bacterium CG22_combo_CG10-13_8_21_14_all_39_12]